MPEKWLFTFALRNVNKYVLVKAGVELLRSPEADDRVDDRGSVDRSTAINNGDDNSILLTIVAERKIRIRKLKILLFC